MTVEEAIEFFGNNDQFNSFINSKLELQLNDKENKHVKKKISLEEKKHLLVNEILKLETKIEQLNKQKNNLTKEIKEIKNSCINDKIVELTDAMCIEHLKNSSNTYEIYLHQKILL